jgi:hypothetical protein
MNLGNLLTASALRNPHKAALITGVGRNLRDHRRIWVEKNGKSISQYAAKSDGTLLEDAALCLTSFAYRDLVSDI